MIRYLCIKLCCGSLTKAPNEKCLWLISGFFYWLLCWCECSCGGVICSVPRLFYLHVWKSLGGVGINIIQQPRIRGGNPPTNQQIPKSPSLNHQTKHTDPNCFFTLGSVWCHWEVISCLWAQKPHPPFKEGGARIAYVRHMKNCGAAPSVVE